MAQEIFGKRRTLSREFVLAFFLPFFLFMLLCAIRSVTPFGDSTLMSYDMNGQYIHFYAYLKSIFAGNNDFFYSFSKGIGGDMVGFTAYYLMSPFTLVFALVPDRLFPLALTFVTASKIGLCGLCFAIFLEIRSDVSRDTLLFSTAYALCAYVLCNFFNLMWLDGIYALPLVALGIERLIKEKRFALYTLSLAYGLITDYYVGYMLCLFSVLYFAYILYLELPKPIHGALKSILRFAAASLLAGGLSAFLLVPTFLALSGTKAGIDSSLFQLTRVHTFRELALAFFYPCKTLDTIDGFPAVFCGCAPAVLVILYFFSGKIGRREKLGSAIFTIVMLFSLNIFMFYVIWHGFSLPSGFPYRHAFVPVFFMLLTASRAWSAGGFKPWHIAAASAVIAALPALAKPWASGVADMRYLAAELILLTLTLTLLLLCIRCGRRRILVSAFALVQTLSLTLNLSLFNTDFQSEDSYIKSTSSTAKVMELVRNYDDGFFRMEFNLTGGVNSPMHYGYNGLSHFSSSEKTRSKEFLSSFGLYHYGNYWVSYDEMVPCTVDSFWGLKYLVGKEPPYKNYNDVGHSSAFSIYENEYALPLITAVANEVCQAQPDEPDTFSMLNSYYSAMSGLDTHIFTPVSDIAVSLENLRQAPDVGGFSVYALTAGEGGAQIELSFTVEKAGSYYGYISDPDWAQQPSTLYVNGESKGGYFSLSDHGIFYLGDFNAGQRVTVTVEPTQEKLYIGTVSICHEDIGVLAQHCAGIQGRSSKAFAEKLSSSHVLWSGEVKESSSLLFTVPADKGWSVLVDGEKAGISPAFGCLIAVPLSEGAHTVEFRFVPEGLALGAAVSAAGAALFILWTVLSKKKLSPPER